MGEERETEITAPLTVAQPTPEVADALSREPDLPHNIMFMGYLTHTRNYSIQDLGGPDYLVTWELATSNFEESDRMVL